MTIEAPCALSVIPAQIGGSDIVLRLSGGLDSSIIAACLAKAKVQFSCINFPTRARDGDERNYAREGECTTKSPRHT